MTFRIFLVDNANYFTFSKAVFLQLHWKRKKEKTFRKNAKTVLAKYVNSF